MADCVWITNIMVIHTFYCTFYCWRVQSLGFARATVIWIFFLLFIFFHNRIRWNLDGNTIATNGVTRGRFCVLLRLIGHGSLRRWGLFRWDGWLWLTRQ